MKDFGHLNAAHSTCTVCGSNQHFGVEHHRLNEQAPAMLELLKNALDSHDKLGGRGRIALDSQHVRAILREIEGE